MWFSPLILILSFPSLNIAESDCQVLLKAFSNATSQFDACAIHNCRPITLCENCVEIYMNVIDTYGTMQKISDNGTLCIDQFINLDRLQIIQTMYQNSVGLWNKAKCYECYQIINGTLTPNKSQETKTFKEKYDTFMSCVNRSDVNNTTICPTCMNNYLDLNLFYNSISNENDKIGVCMDLVDLMNTTRTFWSLKCCEYRKHDEYIFIASSATVLVITLLFYVVTQFCGVKNSPTILQQRRFAESLNQPDNQS